MKLISIYRLADNLDICRVIISDINQGEKSSFFCPFDCVSHIVQLNLNF